MTNEKSLLITIFIFIRDSACLSVFVFVFIFQLFIFIYICYGQCWTTKDPIRDSARLSATATTIIHSIPCSLILLLANYPPVKSIKRLPRMSKVKSIKRWPTMWHITSTTATFSPSIHRMTKQYGLPAYNKCLVNFCLHHKSFCSIYCLPCVITSSKWDKEMISLQQ